MFKLNSLSARETIDFGQSFSKALNGGDVVLLEGSLGGGKTTFVKGILKGLGYKQRVLSPSFTLLRQYELRSLTVYHLDLYRLETADLFDLGLDDFLYSSRSITLIEWGGKIGGNLSKYLKVEFIFSGENKRSLRFSSKGCRREKLKSIKGVYS